MDRLKNLVGIVVFVSLAALGAAWAADAEKALDNAEIVKLTKLDMGDSVIIAKIKSASSVQFATGTDDLVKLKEAGVSKAVIAAMLDRSAPPQPVAAAASPGHGGGGGGGSSYKVTLKASDATVELTPIDGDVKTIVAPFVGMRRFIIFSDVEASTRTKDHKPSVVVASDKDPRKAIWFVKVDQDKDKEDMNRSIDVESPGMWGGMMSSAPDDDMQIKCDIKEDGPGMWRFTPLKDLKPGEYGLYVGKGEMSAILFDFGIDK
jgi:hypothetical protein